MIDVDTDALSRYLTVSGSKLRSKGVASVRSRVVNLKELCPDIDTDRLKAAILEAFREIYSLLAEPLEAERLREAELRQEAAAFASESWLFPPRIPFSAALENRYAWGSIRVELVVRGNRVVQAECVSDAMDESLIRRIRDALQDCPYSGEDLAARVIAVAAGDAENAAGQETRARTGQDIAEMLRTGIPQHIR